MVATPTGGSVALTGRSLVLLAALACSCKASAAHVNPSTHAAAGFVQSACFAGLGLAVEFGGRSSLAAALKNGPWLVLDSARSVDERATGNATAPPIKLSRGLIISRPDSLHVIFGRWHWAGADSILFEEQSVFPAAEWHLAVMPSGLQGYGIMISDLVVRRLDGTSGGLISRWPTQLRRVNCTRVPER